MKEILFRAKAINRNPDREYRTNYKNGDWVYGLITKLYDAVYNSPAEMKNTDGVSDIEIDCNTIGQFTGLRDKNEVKIFEGDIVRFGNTNYLVFWNGEAFQWQIRMYKNGYNFPVYAGQDTGFPAECVTLGWVAAEIPILGTMSTEVIGNIYDNPELIKEEEPD